MAAVVDRPRDELLAEPSELRPARAEPGDRAIVTALCLLFALVVGATWRKWGVPEIDAGAELTTADRVAHGAMPYADIRYFYGPLGLGGLALSFKVLGSSFATAFAFGIVETAAILAAFYALARQFIAPLAAGLGTAVLLAIAFSGTAFDFVLPHTNSATTAILCLLLELLLIARRRFGWAGFAAGLVALTRPEFAAVAAGVAALALVGTWRDDGFRAARLAAVRLALPAIAVPLLVYGALAAEVGASRLLWENLWPVDFIRANGLKAQEDWAPISVAGAAGLVVRALVYGGLLAAVVVATLRRREGLVRALSPLAAAAAAIALVDLAARALGVLPEVRLAVEEEIKHLTLGMSVLPAVALAAFGWAAARFVRRKPAPLSGSWAIDLAVLGAAAALGLRAYNAFTTEGSYAPYYAAPLVLVLAILHQRVADRWPRARVGALAALGCVGAGLAAFALAGLYADDSAPVETARGTFVAPPDAASALQGTLDVLRTTEPERPILAAPADGGLYFMSDRTPALYEVMLLPGLLDSRADEQAAIDRMRTAGVRTVVIAARDLSAFGPKTFGSDYNAALGNYVAGATVQSVAEGNLAEPAAGTYPSRGFRVLTLGR